MSPVNVFEGLIMATGPPGAWFKTGISNAEQGDSYAPITPTTSSLRAYAFAFEKHLSTSNPPACAVESSHDW